MSRKEPSAEKKAEWAQRAAIKGGIVPKFFEVFPDRVKLECGSCAHSYQRPLVPNIDEPIFVCPNCQGRNWVPIMFKLR